MKQTLLLFVLSVLFISLFSVPGTAQDLPLWDLCNTSSQCTSGCCSGVYSSNVPKCTPAGSTSDCINGGGDGPTAFLGNQTGIGSWYDANGDGTNGNSWCGFPYNNASPVFAPDISQMTNGTNAVYPSPEWAVFGKIYCGLEAVVIDGNTGNKMIMYLGDAFDHQWVRTPGSIDIMADSWSQLHDMPATNHDDVINPVEWYFTGGRSTQYCFQCAGN